MAGELRISMLIEANTARAKAEVAALRQETTGLGQAGREAAAGVAQADDGTAEWGSAVQMLRASIQPMVAEAYALAAAAQQLATYEEAGALTARESAIAHDQLARMAIDLQARMDALGVTIDGSTAAMVRHDTAVQELIARSTGMSRAEGESIADHLRHGQALDDLRARFDPLFAVSRRYELELMAIAEAERQGAINSSVAAEARQRAAAAMGAMDDALVRQAAAQREADASSAALAARLEELRTKFNPLFAASQRYEQELREIAEAERMGALSASLATQARERAAQAMTPAIRQIGQSAQQANAHLANLGFQANDIFMMMAAGQNPMMLAIQQGTQVAQVFGMMRQEGQALGPAIRSALLGMVSPMSLVTMGAIALGTFAVQALMSMESEAKSAEDAIIDVTGSVREFGSQSKRSAADIVADFGAINPVLVEMQRNLTGLAQTRSLLDLRKTFQSLRGELSGDFFNTGSQEIADLLGVEAYRRDRPSKVASAPVAAFQRGLKALQTAEGPSSQLEVVRRLEQQLVAVAGGIDQMNAAQLTYYDSLIATEGAIERIVAAQAQAQRQAIELARATGTENTRMGGPTIVDNAKPNDPGKGFQAARDLLAAGREEVELARLKLAYGGQSAEVRAEEARQANAAVEAKIRELGIDRDSLQAQQMRGQEAVRQALAEAARIAAARTAGAQMMAQHQQEARIVELTAKWGADSLEVAYARAAAEREVYEAQIEAQGYTGQTAADLLDAWDAARGVASVNMAAGIGAAAAEAQLLASMLGVSLNQAVALMGLAGKATKPAGTPGRLGFGISGSAADGLGLGPSAGLSWGDNPGSHQSTAEEWRPYRSLKEPKGGGGAKKEANALAELIQREREQIEALRILDPVQAEILKNHEALKGATDAEKLSVTELIAERMRLEQIRDRLDQIGETGRNAFQQLLSGATSLGGALAMVLDKLAEMLASDAWDMIWGGGSGGGLNLGGLIGGLLGLGGSSGGTGTLGLPLPFADGGLVMGRGGPRDDKNLALLSNHEFVVNAEATARNLPLLQALNGGANLSDMLAALSGGRPIALADGGYLGNLNGGAAPTSWNAGRIGRDTIAGGGGSFGGKMQLDIRIGMDRDRNWQATVRDIATDTSIEVSQVVVEEWSRMALPGRVAEIDANPRVRG